MSETQKYEWPTVEEKAQAQREYRKRTKSPCFAPDGGICFKCGRQIFEKISLKRAFNHLITGCPYCHRSYVS